MLRIWKAASLLVAVQASMLVSRASSRQPLASHYWVSGFDAQELELCDRFRKLACQSALAVGRDFGSGAAGLRWSQRLYLLKDRRDRLTVAGAFQGHYALQNCDITIGASKFHDPARGRQRIQPFGWYAECVWKCRKNLRLAWQGGGLGSRLRADWLTPYGRTIELSIAPSKKYAQASIRWLLVCTIKNKDCRYWQKPFEYLLSSHTLARQGQSSSAHETSANAVAQTVPGLVTDPDGLETPVPWSGVQDQPDTGVSEMADRFSEVGSSVSARHTRGHHGALGAHGSTSVAESDPRYSRCSAASTQRLLGALEGVTSSSPNRLAQETDRLLHTYGGQGPSRLSRPAMNQQHAEARFGQVRNLIARTQRGEANPDMIAAVGSMMGSSRHQSQGNHASSGCSNRTFESERNWQSRLKDETPEMRGLYGDWTTNEGFPTLNLQAPDSQGCSTNWLTGPLANGLLRASTRSLSSQHMNRVNRGLVLNNNSSDVWFSTGQRPCQTDPPTTETGPQGGIPPNPHLSFKTGAARTIILCLDGEKEKMNSREVGGKLTIAGPSADVVLVCSRPLQIDGLVLHNALSLQLISGRFSDFESIPFPDRGQLNTRANIPICLEGGGLSFGQEGVCLAQKQSLPQLTCIAAHCWINGKIFAKQMSVVWGCDKGEIQVLPQGGCEFLAPDNPASEACNRLGFGRDFGGQIDNLSLLGCAPSSPVTIHPDASFAPRTLSFPKGSQVSLSPIDQGDQSMGASESAVGLGTKRIVLSPGARLETKPTCHFSTSCEVLYQGDWKAKQLIVDPEVSLTWSGQAHAFEGVKELTLKKYAEVCANGGACDLAAQNISVGEEALVSIEGGVPCVGRLPDSSTPQRISCSSRLQSWKIQGSVAFVAQDTHFHSLMLEPNGRLTCRHRNAQLIGGSLTLASGAELVAKHRLCLKITDVTSIEPNSTLTASEALTVDFSETSEADLGQHTFVHHGTLHTPQLNFKGKGKLSGQNSKFEVDYFKLDRESELCMEQVALKAKKIDLKGHSTLLWEGNQAVIEAAEFSNHGTLRSDGVVSLNVPIPSISGASSKDKQRIAVLKVPGGGDASTSHLRLLASWANQLELTLKDVKPVADGESVELPTSLTLLFDKNDYAHRINLIAYNLCVDTPYDLHLRKGSVLKAKPNSESSTEGASGKVNVRARAIKLEANSKVIGEAAVQLEGQTSLSAEHATIAAGNTVKLKSPQVTLASETDVCAGTGNGEPNNHEIELNVDSDSLSLQNSTLRSDTVKVCAKAIKLEANSKVIGEAAVQLEGQTSLSAKHTTIAAGHTVQLKSPKVRLGSETDVYVGTRNVVPNNHEIALEVDSGSLSLQNSTLRAANGSLSVKVAGQFDCKTSKLFGSRLLKLLMENTDFSAKDSELVSLGDMQLMHRTSGANNATANALVTWVKMKLFAKDNLTVDWPGLSWALTKATTVTALHKADIQSKAFEVQENSKILAQDVVVRTQEEIKNQGRISGEHSVILQSMTGIDNLERGQIDANALVRLAAPAIVNDGNNDEHRGAAILSAGESSTGPFCGIQIFTNALKNRNCGKILTPVAQASSSSAVESQEAFSERDILLLPYASPKHLAKVLENAEGLLRHGQSIPDALLALTGDANFGQAITANILNSAAVVGSGGQLVVLADRLVNEDPDLEIGETPPKEMGVQSYYEYEKDGQTCYAFPADEATKGPAQSSSNLPPLLPRHNGIIGKIAYLQAPIEHGKPCALNIFRDNKQTDSIYDFRELSKARYCQTNELLRSRSALFSARRSIWIKTGIVQCSGILRSMQSPVKLFAFFCEMIEVQGADHWLVDHAGNRIRTYEQVSGRRWYFDYSLGDRVVATVGCGTIGCTWGAGMVACAAELASTVAAATTTAAAVGACAVAAPVALIVGAGALFMSAFSLQHLFGTLPLKANPISTTEVDRHERVEFFPDEERLQGVWSGEYTISRVALPLEAQITREYEHNLEGPRDLSA